MSKFFIKNTLNNIISELSESSNSLERSIQVIDNAVQTSDKNEHIQQGGYLSTTSDINSNHTVSKNNYLSTTSDINSNYTVNKNDYPSTTNEFSLRNNGLKGGSISDVTSSAYVQQGGNFSATSMEQVSDINKLVSMLSSESNANKSETNTDSLEEKLFKVLNQEGGKKGKKTKKQKGGNNFNVNDIKQFFMNLKSQGVNVNVKLDNKSMTDFFASEQQFTTTDLPREQEGGKNPGFLAFAKLKNHIAKKLGITSVAISAKVASVINKEMKAKYSKESADVIADKGIEHFNKNKDTYEKMATKLAGEKHGKKNNKKQKNTDTESIKSETSGTDGTRETDETDEDEEEEEGETEES